MGNVAIVRYCSVSDTVQIIVPSKKGEESVVDREYPVDFSGLVSVEVLRRLRDLQDNYGYEIEVY